MNTWKELKAKQKIYNYTRKVLAGILVFGNFKGVKMKTALITGASGAIGRETVKAFVRKGYFVTAQYNCDCLGILSLKEELEKEGFLGCVNPVKADFSKKGEAERLIAEHLKTFKRVDVLVNNAGVDLYKLAQDTQDDEWDKLFDINVKASYVLTREALKGMIEQKGGKILFVSSIWGVAGGSLESCYSATKSALIGYAKALAKEVGPSNINVNCICPGVIRSPMNDGYTEEEMADIISKTPLCRIGEPSEIAEIIYFLCSEKASFITGQAITCDGGFIL